MADVYESSAGISLKMARCTEMLIHRTITKNTQKGQYLHLCDCLLYINTSRYHGYLYHFRFHIDVKNNYLCLFTITSISR